jgi:hypothetical protein
MPSCISTALSFVRVGRVAGLVGLEDHAPVEGDALRDAPLALGLVDLELAHARAEASSVQQRLVRLGAQLDRLALEAEYMRFFTSSTFEGSGGTPASTFSSRTSRPSRASRDRFLVAHDREAEQVVQAEERGDDRRRPRGDAEAVHDLRGVVDRHLLGSLPRPTRTP